MVEKIVERFLTIVTEPFMVLALLVIVGLYRLLLVALKDHADGLAACNNSICGMVPLLEVLVYGKGGKHE